MSQKAIQELDLKFMKAKVADVRTGYTVKVKTKIKEGKKDFVQIFEGLVIKIHKAGLNSTITVKKVSDGIGVEKIFPIHSKIIESIEIVKVAKIRRAKLYYMRERFGKGARLKERQINTEEKAKMVKEFNVPKKEEEKVESTTEEAK